MKALITGAHGFVGRYLTEHLEAEGDEVGGGRAEIELRRPGALLEAILDEGRADFAEGGGHAVGLDLAAAHEDQIVRAARPIPEHVLLRHRRG